jgi:hypothetical protein
MAESDVIERSVLMGKHGYCSKCGLEYRRSAVIDREGICDECDPEGFKEQYNKDIVWMKKRTIGQKHITENTFFPDKPKHFHPKSSPRRVIRTETETATWRRRMPFWSQKRESE